MAGPEIQSKNFRLPDGYCSQLGYTNDYSRPSLSLISLVRYLIKSTFLLSKKANISQFF